MGAASGLLAAVLFVISTAVFLSSDPSGSPTYPAIEGAQQAPAFLAAHVNAYRIELLLMTLGLVLFLWFLGSLRVVLAAAEGEPGRGSTLAVAGAGVGTGLMLTGIVLGFTSALSTSPAQAATVPTLYTAGALLFAVGGGALSVFFFAGAKVILQTGAMARWLGVLAFVAALLCLFGFLTPFFDKGLLDAATGVLGRWAWYGLFIIWLLAASLMLTAREYRRARDARAPVPSQADSTEGAA
jgi:hypothetical protein